MMVLCIKDRQEPSPAFEYWTRLVPNRPVKGLVYHIRSTFFDNTSKQEGYLLCELINPVVTWAGGQVCEGGFPTAWFREIKTPDIGVFAAIKRAESPSASAQVGEEALHGFTME